VLSVAIIATVFVALIGLLPAGLGASRQAVDSSVSGAVLEAVHQRLGGEILQVGTPAFSPLFFDAEGVAIPANAPDADLRRRLYRADVEFVRPASQPANTTTLLAARISLSWPVSLSTGAALGADNPHVQVSYPVATHTGPDWTAIDSSFRPKVEF
jgi:uncharacterized protein (TIGR02598 family)